jgi:hypothetical protein
MVDQALQGGAWGEGMKFGWKPELVSPAEDTRWSKAGFKFSFKSTYADNGSVVGELDLDGCILDQGNTGSCVAQALANAIRIMLGSQAVNQARRKQEARFVAGQLIRYSLPARRWIYRLARETHDDHNEDDGTWISSAIHVLKTLGWPDEKHVPWDERLINAPMDATARRHAIDQKEVVKEYAITSWGDDRIAQIRHAISLGYPIVFGAYVDQEFLSCTTWKSLELKGDNLGGHAMVIIGYSPEGVHILNSWGPDWGLGGIGLLSWDAVGKRIRDLRVITLAKGPTT